MQITTSTGFAILSTLSAFAKAYIPRAAAETIGQGAAITWKGKIFAERSEYTLYGDARSLYEQIRTIRPDYDPFEFEPELASTRN